MITIKKRLVLKVAIVMMMTLMLAACGSKSSESQPPASIAASTSSATEAPTASPSPAPTASPKVLNPYQIDIYLVGAPPQKDQATVEGALNDYLKDKINATVKLNFVDWGQWDNTINLKTASNEKFDILFTANWLGMTSQIAKGTLLPLEDLLDKDGQDIKKLFDPALIEGAKVDGHLYNLLVNKEFATQKGVFIDKAAAEKYGFDYTKVTKVEDLEPLLAAAHKDNIAGLYSDAGSSMASRFLSDGFYDTLGDGVGVLSRAANDTKVIDLLQTDDYMNDAKLMRKWYQAGYVNKDAATAALNPNDLIKAGKSILYFNYLKPGVDKEVSLTIGKEVVTVPLMKPRMLPSVPQANSMSISTTSKDPERVMMFLNLLYSDPVVANLIDFGVEGKHYVKTGENEIDFPPGVKPEDVGYNHGLNWQIGNQFITFIHKGEDPNKWNNYRQYNADAELSKAMGFSFNPENVKTELASLANVVKEFAPAIENGVVDPEVAIPKYIAKMKAAGSEKVIAEKQKQLDAWLASKK